MNGITVQELQQWVANGADFQLIDVREQEEHDAFNIGGDLLPLGEVARHLKKIHTSKPVVVYCRKGIRSQVAIQKLQEKFPFQNLFNLIGGTEAWKKSFDQS